MDVGPGQFVLAAEPIGTMSGAPRTAQLATAKTEMSQSAPHSSAPVLYIEFRKDGQPMDSESMVGRLSSEGAGLMRKTDLVFWTFLTMTGLAGATTVFNVTQTYSANSPNSELYRQLDLFGDVFERVRSDYVEKPDDTMLVESAINGMLAALDPHSSYMSPKNYRDMQVQTRGEFGGLGIEVTMENGIVKVVSPIDETPASKAGIQANDLITHLDNEQISGLTLEQAVEKMRGPVNTPITLTIVRKGKEEPFDVKITRDFIRINADQGPQGRRRRRLHQGDDLQRADPHQSREGHGRPQEGARSQAAGASSSICATTRAASSIRPSPCRMTSSSAARSC